jgi:hypothetical protein
MPDEGAARQQTKRKTNEDVLYMLNLDFSSRPRMIKDPAQTP